MILKLEKVRCWKLKVNYKGNDHDIFITYPEGENGYKLVSCLNCGKIYSANITKEIYIGPKLDVLMNSIICEQCGKNLGDTGYLYPDKFLCFDKSINEFKRNFELPSDKDSIICEFPELYSFKS